MSRSFFQPNKRFLFFFILVVGSFFIPHQAQAGSCSTQTPTQPAGSYDCQTSAYTYAKGDFHAVNPNFNYSWYTTVCILDSGVTSEGTECQSSDLNVGSGSITVHCRNNRCNVGRIFSEVNGTAVYMSLSADDPPSPPTFVDLNFHLHDQFGTGLYL